MRKILKGLLVVIILVVLIFAGGMLYLNVGLEKGLNVEINGIDMSDVHDGIYNGSYKAGRWSNKIAVTVEGKRITDIEIVDDVTFAKPEVSDELFLRVIKAQNTDIDAVSGSTVTCKAYLKSIENALNNK
jgi:uncharacterized protein with FMN-binding domain